MGKKDKKRDPVTAFLLFIHSVGFYVVLLVVLIMNVNNAIYFAVLAATFSLKLCGFLSKKELSMDIAEIPKILSKRKPRTANMYQDDDSHD